MKEYNFYQDVKVSIWLRQRFSIEAESKKEAMKEAKRYFTEDASDYVDDISTDCMYDTEERLSPLDNDNQVTIELYDADTDKLLGKNV